MLAAGASYPPLTLTVNVASNAPATVTNTATVSGGGETNAQTTGRATPRRDRAVPPDLTLAKTHAGSFTQGQTAATYTLTVTNGGRCATAGTVTVTDTVPSGADGDGDHGDGWTCTQPAGPCTRSDVLAAGASYPAITLTVNVASNAAASVTNTATVSGGGETNTANDSASDVNDDPGERVADDHRLVQHTGQDAGTTQSSTLAFPANNTAGNFIAVVIRAGKRDQVFTVSDTRGNTYRRALQINQTLDTTTVAIYYAENIAGGANTVTVSDTVNGGTLRFAILEYAGVATAEFVGQTGAPRARARRSTAGR